MIQEISRHITRIGRKKSETHKTKLDRTKSDGFGSILHGIWFKVDSNLKKLKCLVLFRHWRKKFGLSRKYFFLHFSIKTSYFVNVIF